MPLRKSKKSIPTRNFIMDTSTLTVGELIGILKEFNKKLPVCYIKVLNDRYQTRMLEPIESVDLRKTTFNKDLGQYRLNVSEGDGDDIISPNSVLIIH